MLVLSRKLGQSIVVGFGDSITLDRILVNAIQVSITEELRSKQSRSIILCPNEPIEIFPEVHVSFLGFLADRTDVIRLGLLVPREIPVHRKEVSDSLHSQD
jgi:sRNA-binding carbon storage regulator CsrA